MATYEGSTGIKALKDKINMKSRMLVGESLEKITVHMTNVSVIGAEFYRSVKGNIENDNGQYKNSWVVGLGTPSLVTREGDTTGAASVADAITKATRYNLEPSSYITNNTDYAQMVETGWNDNPEYGWKAKDGYHVVAKNIGAVQAILLMTATKISKM